MLPVAPLLGKTVQASPWCGLCVETQGVGGVYTLRALLFLPVAPVPTRKNPVEKGLGLPVLPTATAFVTDLNLALAVGSSVACGEGAE